MIKKTVTLALSGCIIFLALTAGAATAGEVRQDPEAARVEELARRMLKDAGIMEIILSLQNDPDMQELLNDPVVAEKIQAGDLSGLAEDPRLEKIISKPEVKAVERRLQ